MTREEITIYPRYTIKTKCWKDLEGNIVVEWDGVLLVYPDFGEFNAK